METMIAVTALLGVFHSMSPDHWVPLSVLSWQRALSTRQLLEKTAALVAGHLGLALLMAWILMPVVAHSGLTAASVLRVGALLVAGAVLVRMRRLERMLEVFRGGNHGKGALMTTLSLLGPAESLVPLLLKARIEGHSGLPVLALYGGLTFATISTLAILGHRLWNDPTRLARGLSLLLKPSFSFPVAAVLGLSLVAMLQFA